MAGGSNRPGTGLPAWLTAANDAVRAEHAGHADRAEQAARRAAWRPPRRVHCWVHSSDGNWPGLVLDWCRRGQGWWARVVWTRQRGGLDEGGQGGQGAELVTAWVQAAVIEPVAEPAVSAPTPT